MRLPLRARAARLLVAAGLAASALLPGTAATVRAADPLVLKVGTEQDLQVLKPWHSVTVADFEVFTLNYDLLANFGPDLSPVPGFAETWTQDGTKGTFKNPTGMKLSAAQ